MRDLLNGTDVIRGKPAGADSATRGCSSRKGVGRPARLTLAAAAIGSLLAAPAFADREVFDMSNATYRAECGSCHIPYPPQLLPKESWRAVMAGLPKHFGSDASVDAKIAKEIESYLTANAARKGGAAAAPPPLRITETRWFRHEHDEVPARVWKNPAVKSPSNCGACHTGAERGDFSEHNVRLPN